MHGGGWCSQEWRTAEADRCSTYMVGAHVVVQRTTRFQTLHCSCNIATAIYVGNCLGLWVKPGFLCRSKGLNGPRKSHLNSCARPNTASDTSAIAVEVYSPLSTTHNPT